MKGRKKIWIVLLTWLCLLLGNTSFVYGEERHDLQFFFENVCASCKEEEKFYELFNRCISSEEKQTISYEIRTHNVFVGSEREIYEKALKDNGITDKNLPLLVIDGQGVSGYDKIENELRGILLEGKKAADISAEEITEEITEETEGSDDFEIPDISAPDGQKAILLFTTYSCTDCAEVKEYLKELSGSTDFAITECSIADGNHVALFKELLGIYGKEDKDGKVPAVFVGDQVLIGKEEIQQSLPELLDAETGDSRVLKEKLQEIRGKEEVTESSMGTLAVAGLLAGFNPCAVSMLLMLFSILLTGNASVLKNGALYLVGKYLTYFGLGAGICFAASKVDQDFLTKFGKGMNLVIVVLFVAVAVMNFTDFLNVRKFEYGKVRMQLPKGLRRFNHKLLKRAEHMEGAFLGILALGLGIAISLGEFFCTGQIYMASILYLLRNGGQFLQMTVNLLVYVTAMCIPAVVIMAVIYRTKSAGKVSDFMLKHMAAIKLLNCVLFLFYAVYFVLNMG